MFLTSRETAIFLGDRPQEQGVPVSPAPTAPHPPPASQCLPSRIPAAPWPHPMSRSNGDSGFAFQPPEPPLRHAGPPGPHTRANLLARLGPVTGPFGFSKALNPPLSHVPTPPPPI